MAQHEQGTLEGRGVREGSKLGDHGCQFSGVFKGGVKGISDEGV